MSVGSENASSAVDSVITEYSPLAGSRVRASSHRAPPPIATPHAPVARQDLDPVI